MTTPALPPVTDPETWQRELAALRVREKAATRELDAIAAQRRRLPIVELPAYTLQGPHGPVSLIDLFDGASQLVTMPFNWGGSV